MDESDQKSTDGEVRKNKYTSIINPRACAGGLL